MFGQVINRVGKIAHIGHKQGEGFEKWAAHPHPVFSASSHHGLGPRSAQVPQATNFCLWATGKS